MNLAANIPNMTAKTTTKQSKKNALAREVEQAKPKVQGWLSTDEDEIQRRRWRGLEEPIEVDPEASDHPIFGTFMTRSESGGHYRVEIRSLDDLINSCECPDFVVNGLGTCKHVEGVLSRLRKQAGFSRAEAWGNERVEIYVDRRDGRLRVAWPPEERIDARVRQLLEPFFSSDGTLLADPLTAAPALRRKIAAAPPEVKANIRWSDDIAAWLEERRRRAEPQRARAAFLQDVEQGKRSLDIVNVPLYSYQREGMMHLAFTERNRIEAGIVGWGLRSEQDVE